LGRGSRLEGRNPSWHQEGIPLIRKRAAAAVGGIYGNDAVEAMYPLTRVTADGETIDTGKHNYTITLAAGQFPPVNAFWSVTMYDGENQLLIENPINRYLITRRLGDDADPEGFSSRCGCTGPKRLRRRSCRPVREPGPKGVPNPNSQHA
jgi:hypothetical protein